MTSQTPENSAPFQKGNVPNLGWYPIETVHEHAITDVRGGCEALGIDPGQDPTTALAESGVGLQFLDQEGIKAIAQNTPIAAKGIPLTLDHQSSGSSRAAGWVKELAPKENYLWALIELTPYGLELINSGEYAYFSTEYSWQDFTRTKTPEGKPAITPKILAGLSIVNEPRHPTGVPCTNSGSKSLFYSNKTMVKKTKQTNANEEIQEETQTNSELSCAPEKEKQTNSELSCDPEKEKQTNSDGDPGTALAEIADELDLPETATTLDLIDAVKALKESLSEMREALAEANSSPATQSNSKRNYPNLAKLRSVNSARLSGGKPNENVAVVIAGRRRQSNAQDCARVEFIETHIAKAETRLGRSLNPSEYSREYSMASRSYGLTQNH